MNLFELFVKIGDDDQASGKLSDLSSKLGNGLKTAAKIGTAAVGAAAAGITALTTAAVNNYAEYEQLVGGVETLFKDSAGKVQEYAANAYKTAGMSANEYMSTVTSFSASLLQSLGGDTDKAAEYANQALTEMSDNANKMGTSMEMIQNAYQGFAKQNYTMLDNLKLGYGGTKEEMARLIEDAAKLSDTVDAQDMSFANIVKAINVVQTEMGITGTTALEAGRTISGSVGAMESAWQNLITGLADGNADIEQLVDNLVTTIVGDGTESNLGVIGNVLPAIETALNGAGRLIEEALPIIIDQIPDFIEKYLPKILESGVSIVLQIVAGLIKAVPQLIETVPKLTDAILNAFNENADTFLDIGKQIVNGVWNGISSMIKWFTGKVKGFFSGIVDGVKDTLGIHSPSRVFAGIGGFMAEGLADGWDKEYNGIKRSIEKDLNFGTATVDFASSGIARNSSVFSNSASKILSNANENITIVVQSVLDGRVIGESAYQYNLNRQRAYGGAY